MMNYRVTDMDALVKALKDKGVEIVDEVETHDYGKFVHIIDGDGSKIELWEPNDEVHDDMVGQGRTK